MIADKLRMIKQKSSEASPTLIHQNNSIPLTPYEIIQITARLNQIKPQIPQIDKLLLLHAKLPSPPPAGTNDMVKKLSDCRNILVHQLEVSDNSKKLFVMNLTQLNLLIEQVQKLFNSLVSKMKESAGITSGNINNNTNNINNSFTANTSNSNNLPNSNPLLNTNNIFIGNSPLTVASSLSSASSVSSISTINSKILKKSIVTNTHSLTAVAFDKILLQRLSLPSSDDHLVLNDNFITKFILQTEREEEILFKNENLKRRNLLIFNELKLLKNENKIKFCIQEIGGNLNILISQNNFRFIFKVSQKYPYENLIYKIEPKYRTHHKKDHYYLPKKREPKIFPFTITNILRNFDINK